MTPLTLRCLWANHLIEEMFYWLLLSQSLLVKSFMYRWRCSTSSSKLSHFTAGLRACVPPCKRRIVSPSRTLTPSLLLHYLLWPLIDCRLVVAIALAKLRLKVTADLLLQWHVRGYMLPPKIAHCSCPWPLLLLLLPCSQYPSHVKSNLLFKYFS